MLGTIDTSKVRICLVLLWLLSWTITWLARVWLQDSSAAVDLLLHLGVVLYATHTSNTLAFHEATKTALRAYLLVFAAAWLAWYCYCSLSTNNGSSRLQTSPTADSTAASGLRPLIFPSRTHHVRFFPQKHSFSYSYLLVGVPVSRHNFRTVVLSAGDQSSDAWFHVRPADFLERNNPNVSLRGRLEDYLLSQGETPKSYPYAYLVTTPRFLGYSFNPVSFWYLYSERKQLTALILEVNNTFDERRMYLLKTEKKRTGSEQSERGSSTSAFEATKFTGSWAKDFHVSPFNSREGFYSLVAEDVFPFIDAELGKVANNITLTSSEGHKKLVAKVFSTGPAVDPTRLGAFDAVRLVLNWSWVGFVTFPRILKEAWKLYFKRGLAVWFRPEVAPTSVGRSPTDIEWQLESFFFRYLTAMVQGSKSPLCLLYRPAGGTGQAREIRIEGAASTEKLSTTTELHVLSPAFYSRFVQYGSTHEAFDREAWFGNPLNHTVSISNSELLLSVLQESRLAHNTSEATIHGERGMLEQWRWDILRNLRTAPPTPSYQDERSTKVEMHITDIRPVPRLSPLDSFVMQQCPDRDVYRRALCQQFLAERLAFGSTSIVNAADIGLRLAFSYLAIWSLFRMYSIEDGTYLNLGSLHVQVMLAAQGLLGTGVHLWRFVKGLQSAQQRLSGLQS